MKPSSNYYINIHSHRKPILDNEFTIRNAFHFLERKDLDQLNYAVSVGIHPWHVAKSDLEKSMKRLERCLQSSKVLAIGECGLDRSIAISIDLQRSYFATQFELAQRYRKPIIIHSVRSYYDFVPYLKASNVPFIFHRFQGNAQELAQLMKHKAYFSFGKSLIQNHAVQIELFKKIPLNRLFLETDNTNVSIDQVYEKAADLRNIESGEVKLLVFNNFATVFEERANEY
ncbi:TatD family hydrolase [Solitalea koreensis]|uniref:TatD DNase family protein n=1 Tax=Solitalea koreensis TaxID=543615 RepID=A0A521B9J4_9SPHI|nr:TatD family hydrolase [Solitalea koreensis]SMO43759.1 TatD DNase family protein [Solitalea koreensis]